MLHQLLQECKIGFDTQHIGLRDCVLHAACGLGAIFTPSDQLGDHRIVIDADFIARHDASVKPHIVIAGNGRRGKDMHLAGFRKEIVGRIFGTDTNLDSVSAGNDFTLLQWQRLACGHAQLPFDQVFTRDHFRNRVFDLQARIHFHEEELAVLADDEFNRAGTTVSNGARRRDRRITHFLAHIVID